MLSLSNIHKTIGQKEVAKNINLEVEKGEFIVLLGPSGCGKTTLLRMISGLETVTSGQIKIEDRVVNTLSPGDRDVAMVFQNYSLYMHMSVWDNLAFGLRTRKTPRDEIKRQVNSVLDVLRIRSLKDRKPRQLSGGEKQRVAIGRALVRNPKLYLFDEPLSNLDAALRMELRAEISQIHQRFGTTSIYVTHDQVEAMSMADRLVVLNEGKVMQVGKTDDLYSHPQNTFVAGFLGNPGMNLLPANVNRSSDNLSLNFGERGIALTSLGIYSTEQLGANDTDGVTIGFRPEAVRLATSGANHIQIKSKILLVERLGFETQILAESDVGTFRARVRETDSFDPGSPLDLFIDHADLRLFKNDDQRLIMPLRN